MVVLFCPTCGEKILLKTEKDRNLRFNHCGHDVTVNAQVVVKE